MAFYNRLKTMKSAPIGTIMPWSGSSSRTGANPDGIPHGWIPCDGTSYPAQDYPLLAAHLGNTYGPTDEAIQGNFPDFDDADLFRVPNLNGRAMIDLEREYLLQEKYQYNQPDAEQVIGDLISEDGTGVTPPAIYSADTDLLFEMDPLDNMAGRIQEFTLNDPTWSKTYYTIGRKLGIDHTPGHKHSGQYTTAVPSGKYVQVFEAPTFQTSGSPNYESANLTGVTSSDGPDVWTNGFGSITYYDENTLVLTDSTKTFTQQTIPNVGLTRNIPPSGAYSSSFSDTYNYNHQEVAHTGVFPVPIQSLLGRPNYIGGDDTTTFPTNLSHAAENFTEANLANHNHFSFDITMNKSGLRAPQNLAINNIQSYTVNVSDIEKALNIVMDNNTPSQTIIMIIRAY
ncbi:putative short tail fibre [Synechococcus phage S-RSM4]|uniref:Putative short tail fibre n=1 Tax=Synechococcus phage S-RSM4 TaxID=555387 RepID=C7BVI1_9CAUD|nr:short tail fiber protein [Synechococcus phage S-RSM4]CAR63410.1 putative short tail fibre [Synechococcus phage S-RSM4]